MQGFTPIPSFIGGAIIGAAASILLLLSGRIAGISGIMGGAFLQETKDRVERLLFLAGLVIPGAIILAVHPESFPKTDNFPLGAAIIAGLLVGFGTRLGNGCTSGHGICGLSRLSIRSIVATATFMGTAAITIYFTRHVLGVLP